MNERQITALRVTNSLKTRASKPLVPSEHRPRDSHLDAHEKAEGQGKVKFDAPTDIQEAIESAMRPDERRPDVMKRIETWKPNHEEMEPLRKAFDDAAHWLKDYDAANPQGNTHCRAHMAAVMQGLKSKLPALWEEGRLGMVLVGDAFLELDRKMKAGEVPGLVNVGEFSADGGHLRSGLPRYTLVATYYAVLFREHPGKLDWKIFRDRSYYDSGKYGFYVHQPDLAGHLDITPERAKIVNDTIRKVVSKHPYTP